MPQLNFSVPGSLLERIDQAKPDYLDRKGFLCLLIAQALDGCGTLGATSAAGAPSSTSSKNKKESSSIKKNTYLDIRRRIDEKLEFLAEDLISWWELRRKQHGRQAIGTEHAWNASQNALLAILRVHGRQVAQDTVTAALASGWRGIRESYAVVPKAASPNQAPEPSRHPASRVFQGGRFVDEEPAATNPVLAGLF